MNYTLLLIIILIISSIGHIYILNGRVMNKLVSFLPATPHSELETSKHTNKGKVDNLRILLTAMFLFSPLLLFKGLRKASIEDIFTASVLLAIITIISIVGFWFSAVKLKAMNQISLKKAVQKKKSRISRTETKGSIVLKDRFIEFVR